MALGFFSWCCCSLGSNFCAAGVEPAKYDVYDLQGKIRIPFLALSNGKKG